jgi:hypothetical protein
MPIIRLGVATPTANTAQQLTAVLNAHLISVVIANTSAQASPVCKVDVWVQPAGATQATEYAYIASNLTVGVGQSFETFRFAINANDSVYVRSSIAGTSFSAYGLLQADDFNPADLPAVFRNKTIRGINNVIYLDKGQTSQRPVTGSVDIGYVRFNTDTDTLEVLTSTGWKRVTVTD